MRIGQEIPLVLAPVWANAKYKIVRIVNHAMLMTQLTKSKRWTCTMTCLIWGCPKDNPMTLLLKMTHYESLSSSLDLLFETGSLLFDINSSHWHHEQVPIIFLNWREMNREEIWYLNAFQHCGRLATLLSEPFFTLHQQLSNAEDIILASASTKASNKLSSWFFQPKGSLRHENIGTKTVPAISIFFFHKIHSTSSTLFEKM